MFRRPLPPELPPPPAEEPVPEREFLLAQLREAQAANRELRASLERLARALELAQQHPPAAETPRRVEARRPGRRWCLLNVACRAIEEFDLAP